MRLWHPLWHPVCMLSFYEVDFLFFNSQLGKKQHRNFSKWNRQCVVPEVKLLLALLQYVTEGENLLSAREKLQGGDMMIITHLLCLLHQLHKKWAHTTKTRKSSIQLWEVRQLWGPSSYKDPWYPVLTVSCTCLDWQLYPNFFLRICFPSAASVFVW